MFIGSFLLTLVEYPDEQEKIYQEILDVVGEERLPTLEDKSKLPYTNAFIYEVTRLSDFFPMFPSLECTSKSLNILLYTYFEIVVLIVVFITTTIIKKNSLVQFARISSLTYKKLINEYIQIY